MNFYNEPDPYAAQWLRNLIAAGLIAPGVVDTRPIQEIEPWELLGFTQCHFFCGIGVWSYALRAAGWPDDVPIWTGSCPCQPFSQAGKQKGFSDDRHLWPYWQNLIAVCKPPIVIGEQVASALDWLDLVSVDMEAADYAFGASDLCAAGFGGAHIRQRLYFVGLANPGCDKSSTGRRDFSEVCGLSEAQRQSKFGPSLSCGDSAISGLADDDDARRERRQGLSERGNQCAVGPGGMVGGLADTPSKFDNWSGNIGEGRRPEYSDCRAISPAPAIRNSRQARSLDDADWLLCRNPAGEPSWRPVEPGTFPLAHGVASRMGKLRAYGNALDAESAIAFCETVAEIVGIRPVAEYDL